MKAQDFIDLGIPEDLAEKAAALAAEELKGLVPRSRLNEEIQKKKNAEACLLSAQNELEALKADEGNAALQDELKNLQDQLKSLDDTHAAEIANMKIEDAIQAALTKTVDPDMVAGLLDREKITLSNSGEVAGLDEQILGLKNTSPFLFAEGEIYPDVPDGGEPGGRFGPTSTRDRFDEWMSEVMG